VNPARIVKSVLGAFVFLTVVPCAVATWGMATAVADHRRNIAKGMRWE